MNRILLERQAERDLDALDLSLKKRIVGRVLLLAKNPRPHGSKKLTGSASAWRIRIGDWRVIYEIDDRLREVKIYRIKHRSKAY
ncbi:MAG: type II toxin-antitoxin system RelE/ParE family toxin [Minisyncoccia bacterium]